MPLTLAKLTGKTVPATIEVRLPGTEDLEKISIVYKPGVLTAALEDELNRYGQQAVGWADLISKIIVSWDLEETPGKPYPLEFVPPVPAKLGPDGATILEPAKPAGGALMLVPTWLLSAIIDGVKADLRPNPKTDETSGGSS